MYPLGNRFRSKMQPHGLIHLKWQNDILYIETQGPFNIEGIKIAGKHLTDVVENRTHASWRRLDIADDNALGDPEVMKVIAHGYLWGIENGCRAMALVYFNSLQKVLFEHFIIENTVNIQAFSNSQDAQEWLNKQ